MSDGWTDAQVARLKELWAAGASHSQVAADLGCGFTRSAIAGKISRLKINRGRPPSGSVSGAAAGSKLTLPRPKIPPAPPQRRNPHNSIAEKIAIAEAEPGLSPRLKGEKPDGTGIKFLELTAFNCHWPKGDPLDADFEFCGDKALPGMPYCAHHSRMSYEPPKVRARQDKWALLGAHKQI